MSSFVRLVDIVTSILGIDLKSNLGSDVMILSVEGKIVPVRLDEGDERIQK